MKKCILSAMAGAAAMFLAILAFAYFHSSEEPAEYEHVDYLSAIDRADCFLCSAHWSEDNLAILDLNTFQMHRLEIKRYADDGEPVTTKAGYLQTGTMETENGWLNSMTFPDRGYASVQIPNVAYSINGILYRTTYAKAVWTPSTIFGSAATHRRNLPSCILLPMRLDR